MAGKREPRHTAQLYNETVKDIVLSRRLLNMDDVSVCYGDMITTRYSWRNNSIIYAVQVDDF